MDNKQEYRMVRLTDGSTIIGSITVDKDFLRITNALELKTAYTHSRFGINEDSSLAPWLPFTEDKVFVIPRDKVLVITLADKNISHYYEVILAKVEKSKQNAKPVLSVKEMSKIYKLADQMDKVQISGDITQLRDNTLDGPEQEEELFNEMLEKRFGKRTLH